MKSFLKVLIISILSFACTKMPTSEENYRNKVPSGTVLMIYGGKEHNEYLGKINASKYDSESIWNQYGKYGISMGNMEAATTQNPFGTNTAPMAANITTAHSMIMLPTLRFWLTEMAIFTDTSQATNIKASAQT